MPTWSTGLLSSTAWLMLFLAFNHRLVQFLYLGPVQTSNFTYAESNANEKNLLFSLICIRFGTCKVRRLNRALAASQNAAPSYMQIRLNWTLLRMPPSWHSPFNYALTRTGSLCVYIMSLGSIYSIYSHTWRLYLPMLREIICELPWCTY